MILFHILLNPLAILKLFILNITLITADTINVDDHINARIEKQIHDPAWEMFFAPVAAVVGATADWMNVLQFLTIRRYLAFVFVALILLLLVLAL